VEGLIYWAVRNKRYFEVLRDGDAIFPHGTGDGGSWGAGRQVPHNAAVRDLAGRWQEISWMRNEKFSVIAGLCQH